MHHPAIAPYARRLDDLSAETMQRLSRLIDAAPELGDLDQDTELFEATTFDER